MTATTFTRLKAITTANTPAWWKGIALVAVIAGTALAAANTPLANQIGLGALTLAIITGIIAGNTFFPRIAHHTAEGVDFSKSNLLRWGIMLYGFRITFQQVAGVGWQGVLADMLMLTLTFGLALFIGIRLLKLDRQTVILIGAGSSICGAAAILATEPVIRAQAHKVSVAVATVVVFGTLAMFLYPMAYPYLEMTAHQYGLFVGSTVHEVAQVVGAGQAVNDVAGNTAVIEKMLRVMMLAPFLLMLSLVGPVDQQTQTHGKKAERQGGITVPWFAVIFLAISGINSLHVIPTTVVDVLVGLDTVLLTMAMAALGLRTHIGAIKQAGAKPLILAALLFVFLTVGGYFVNRGLILLFA